MEAVGVVKSTPLLVDVTNSFRPSRFSRPKRTENRLIVENLAVEISWQVRKTTSTLYGGPFRGYSKRTLPWGFWLCSIILLSYYSPSSFGWPSSSLSVDLGSLFWNRTSLLWIPLICFPVLALASYTFILLLLH